MLDKFDETIEMIQYITIALTYGEDKILGTNAKSNRWAACIHI